MQVKIKKRLISATIENGEVQTMISGNDQKETLVFDQLLVAVGRRPASRMLGLEEVGVKLSELRAKVAVDDYFQTSLSGVYAIGD
jgi:dihydrolipoamide dehydrogenase